MIWNQKGVTSAEEIWDGVKSVLDQHGDVELIAEAWDRLNRENGQKYAEQFIARFAPGEIDAIIVLGAVAGLGSQFAVDQAGRDDVLLDGVIEPGAPTEAVGVLIEPHGGDDLDSGYMLAIEPTKGRVLFDRWPAAMDPLWDSLVLHERHGIEVTPEIEAPLVERPLAFAPVDGRYRVQLLRKGSAVERFVAEQLVASFRVYETSDTAWGLFVQEGTARFHDLAFRR